MDSQHPLTIIQTATGKCITKQPPLYMEVEIATDIVTYCPMISISILKDQISLINQITERVDHLEFNVIPV